MTRALDHVRVPWDTPTVHTRCTAPTPLREWTAGDQWPAERQAAYRANYMLGLCLTALTLITAAVLVSVALLVTR